MTPEVVAIEPSADFLELTREHALELLRGMVRVRRFEEKCAELYGAGKIRGFLHLYIGEEAIAAGALPLLGADDSLVSTYREHGHALVRGVPMGAVMAEMFGKAEGCSRPSVSDDNPFAEAIFRTMKLPPGLHQEALR